MNEGSNTIKVEVTAGDSTTVQTYTVVVTRAESVVALVSNTGRNDQGDVNIGDKDKEFAQRFRTGLHADGYNLTQVGVLVNDADLESGETMTVHIYTTDSE